MSPNRFEIRSWKYVFTNILLKYFTICHKNEYHECLILCLMSTPGLNRSDDLFDRIQV